MASGDARPVPLKNTAFRVTFPIYDQEGDLVPGATGLDSEVSLDGGTFADCTSEATEIATSSGIYFLDLTAAEMNADTVAVIVKTTSTGAKTTALVLYPAENTDIPVNLTAISGAAVSTSTAQLGVNVVQAAGTAWGSGAITAGVIATDAIGAAELAADAITEIQNGLATSTSITGVLDRIDYQRGHHTVAGATFYVDGIGGNDTTGNGSRALPYKTITKALSVCTSNTHDLIVLLPNAAGGPTTITESGTINVTKNYVQIRGPGRDVMVTLSGAGTVFNISAFGVQLSGMRIVTNSGGSSDGINVNSSADFVSISYCWVENAHRDAIQFNVANNCFVDHCQITFPTRDGVRVSSGAGNGNFNKVLNTIIRSAGGSGINLQGSDASNCRIQLNSIRQCVVGVTISAGAVGTTFSDNRLANNTTDFSDGGTATLEEWNFLQTDVGGQVTLADASLTTAKLGAFALAKTTNITGFNDVSAAQVNAEVVDVIRVDASPEPASIPAANAPLGNKVDMLFAALRNKRTTTSTTDTIRNDADNANIAAAGISDDGTTFTKNEYT